jgi:F-type H+-transporting ATPase subunit b
MHFDWSTLALQTVNFAILVWLLQRFLYKPVLGMVDARRAEIEKRYAEAQATDAKAKDALAAIEAERVRIAAERAAALRSAAAEAEAAAATRHAQAEREATSLLDGARKTIAAERDRTIAETRRIALDLAVEMARRLLTETPTELRAEAWLERIRQHLVSLPDAEREGLVGQLIGGTALKVVSAAALPTDATDAWRRQLRQTLGDRITVAFEADPHLIAGAELHFPNAVLRFSWQSALTAMRNEIEAHDDR